MICHAGLGPPQPIVALAHPMQSSASVRPLVTSIGCAELLPPSSPSAQWAAVALPAIAPAADAENDATATTVVTVGEKIGKSHLTYAQGAVAEITAMATIGAADGFGLPVSTTHVLSSGIAGTMAANHSGIQWSTVRNLALAWVLTLPVAMMLSGSLFWLFRKTF
jgi:hypothetical protein